MFGRSKKDTEEPPKSAEAFDELALPVKPAGRPPAPAAGPMRPPVLPPRTPPETPRPVMELPRRVETPTPPPPAPSRRDTDMRKLIVGREISLAGEITSCDLLVVEGSVEANLANCREIEISESGVFKGSASIEDAEIRGRFDGILNVRRRLLIHASGKVAGTVRYGQLQIECGGQISGDVQAQPTTNEPPALMESRPLIAATGTGDLVE